MKNDLIFLKSLSEAVQEGGSAYIEPITHFSVEASEEFLPPKEGTPQMQYLEDLLISPPGEELIGLDHADLMVFVNDPEEQIRCQLFCLSGNADALMHCLQFYRPVWPGASFLIRCVFSPSDNVSLNMIENIMESIQQQWADEDSLVVFGATYDEAMSSDDVRIIVLQTAEHRIINANR